MLPLEALKTRVSVKRFTNEEVSIELINEIIMAGLSAPSARNIRPYEILVIKNREILDAIAQLNPAKLMLQKAPVCFAIVGNLEANPDSDYVTQDCSAVTENILVAAHALGLGACWLGITRANAEFYKSINQLLELGENSLVVSLVALGHPDGEFFQKPDRYTKEQVRWID